MLRGSAELDLLMMAAVRLSCFDLEEFRDIDTPTRIWR